MSDLKMSDIHAVKSLFKIVPESIYVYVRGYCGLERFAAINEGDAFPVTRLKGNVRLDVLGRRSAPPTVTGGVSDRAVFLAGAASCGKYPAPLRLAVLN